MSDLLTNGNSSRPGTLKLKRKEEIKKCEKYIAFQEQALYLNPDDDQLEYDVSKINFNVHWGQLKLFSTEFHLLTTWSLEMGVKEVLYIGAAPGEHLFVMGKLFKDVTFHLYDSCKFDRRLSRLSNIKIYNKYFDDVEMDKWKGTKDFILISDIRNINYSPDLPDRESKMKNEEAVWEDMKLQQGWIEELRPKVSMIKFRLPFAYDFIIEKGGTRRYLNGQVLKQPFSKPTSSETRLVVTSLEYKDWDLVKYEKQMCYHNRVTRQTQKYLNPVTGGPGEILPEKGLKNDYDSSYLAYLVIQYLKKSGMSESHFRKTCSFILDHITWKRVTLHSKRSGY